MEDIEILDIDDNKIEEKPKVEKKHQSVKKKEKKKLRKGEKIFLIINILIILGIIIFYGYRTIYYYKLTHTIIENVTIKDKLTALSNIAYQNDGLYEDNGYFYYKGVEVDNYVYYSGRMFRIIDINNGIRMIEDDIPIKMVYGIDTNYSDSLVHEVLKDYLNTLKDYEVYLKENDWCNESVDVSNYNCNEKVNEFVGLLSTKDYLQAGGKNSYLNNHEYFWTINTDIDKKAYYVNSEGGINNVVMKDDNYYSYGIRPVITLKEEISILSGEGTKNSPYIIESLKSAMLKDNSISSFVKYQNKMFRIIDIDEEGIMLLYNGVLDEVTYGGIDSSLIKFMNDLNKEDLVKFNYYVNEYNFENKYNYKEEKQKINTFITIPKVGDLFLNDYDNFWVNTISNSKLGLMYTIDNNKLYFGDLKSNKHLVRPIIKLNSGMIVTDGIGTEDNPLLVGDGNEEN